MNNPIPLRQAILLPTVLGLTITAALIAALNGRNAEQSAQHLAVDLQRRTTREVEAFLSSELRGPQQAIRAMADAVASGLVDPHQERATALYLSRLAEVFPNAPFLNYGLADGTFIGVGQAGNRKDGQRVLVITRPETVLRTAQFKLQADGSRGPRDYEGPIGDFRQAPWYAQPLQAGRAIWTQIYNWDDQPEVMALGAGVPILSEGKVIGVAGADMILANINAFLAEVAGSHSLVLYIQDRNGLMVASSTTDRPFDLVAGRALRRPAVHDPNPWIRASALGIERVMALNHDHQEPQVVAFQEQGRRGLVQLTPWAGGEGLRWQIAVVLPEASYTGIVGQQIRDTLTISALALLGASGVCWAVVRLVCRPLERLTGLVESFAAGGSPQPLPPSPILEIQRLSLSLEEMTTKVNQSMAHLKERNAAVEQQIQQRSVQLREANARLEEELDRAAAVQTGMLIRAEQLAELHPGLDISVQLVPSKEVAGDLYDAIPVGSHRICLCIGDVAGKGMPAALLMSTCLSLLRTYVERLDSPAAMMARINHQLGTANEDCAFTTLLIMVYDARSGELRYCNAGHNPALIRRNDGSLQRMDHVHGPALGICEAVYGESELHLAEGEICLAYTDGANETFNPNRQRFGLSRLERSFLDAPTESMESLLNEVLAQLDDFAAGEAHHDDTTLLVFRRLVKNGQDDRMGDLCLRVENNLRGVAEALEMVKLHAQRVGIEKSRLRRLLGVIDELLNNIVTYGCRGMGDQGSIGLELIQSGKRLELTLHDNGRAFDPMSLNSPDIVSESEERPIGGLGIHLVRGMTTACRYRREDNRNWLTLDIL